MALFWSVVAGAEQQQIDVPTGSTGSVRMVALEVESGTSIADGEFIGQMVAWLAPEDEDPRWMPVPNQGGPVMKCEGLNGVNDAAPVRLFLGDAFASLSGTTVQLQSQLANVICQVTDDAGGGEGAWQMSYADGVSATQILGTSNAINLTAGLDLNTPAIRIGHNIGEPQIGFLGTAIVSRQSITGATTQDQVDSIIAALVAFGLCSDDR